MWRVLVSKHIWSAPFLSSALYQLSYRSRSAPFVANQGSLKIIPNYEIFFFIKSVAIMVETIAVIKSDIHLIKICDEHWIDPFNQIRRVESLILNLEIQMPFYKFRELRVITSSKV